MLSSGSSFFCSPHSELPPRRGYYLPCYVLETQELQIKQVCVTEAVLNIPPPHPTPPPSISAACCSSFQLLFPSLRRTFTSLHFEDISQLCEIPVESPSAPPTVHTPKKLLSLWIGHKLGRSGTFSLSMDRRHPGQAVTNPLFLI